MRDITSSALVIAAMLLLFSISVKKDRDKYKDEHKDKDKGEILLHLQLQPPHWFSFLLQAMIIALKHFQIIKIITM